MRFRRLLAASVLAFVLGLTGCAAQCTAPGCYRPHRSSALRGAEDLGTFTGAALGGATPRQASRGIRPGRTLRPVYNFWLDYAVDSLLSGY